MLDTPLKSIRGGAFDTYFDNQAACQFQSGENPLSRRHNIGFRCAVGVGDLVLVRKPERTTRSGRKPSKRKNCNLAERCRMIDTSESCMPTLAGCWNAS